MKNGSLEIMRALKLNGMADAYQTTLGLPINQQPDAHEMLAHLIDAEKQYRWHKRMTMFLRLSKLRYQATIQDIDCSKKRNLTKEKLMLLADCALYRQRRKYIDHRSYWLWKIISILCAWKQRLCEWIQNIVL